MAEHALSPAVVTAALVELGLGLPYATRAAADERIVWTESALAACAHDVDTSGLKKPERALWTEYLQYGKLPALPRTAPAGGALRCEFPDCDADGDLSVCHGIHGYARKVPCWICGTPFEQCWGQHDADTQEEAA